MKLGRINAIVMRHLYLYKGRSLPRFLDIFFWPVMALLTWGFLSLYLQNSQFSSVNFLGVLLGAAILWEIINGSQKAISIYFLEDVWEKNFLNIFVTPLSLGEFFLASVILGFIRIIIIAFVLFLVAIAFYHFNIFSFGIPLVAYISNLFIFGLAIALFINAVILRFGTSAQVLAFGIIFLIQPISAVFYPVSVLPVWAQYFSKILPVSYVFEDMRNTVAGGAFDFKSFVIALSLNALYLLLAWFFFKRMFKKVKEKGILLKVQN